MTKLRVVARVMLRKHCPICNDDGVVICGCKKESVPWWHTKIVWLLEVLAIIGFAWAQTEAFDGKIGVWAWISLVFMIAHSGLQYYSGLIRR